MKIKMTKNTNEIIIDGVDVSGCIYKCKYDNYDCRDMFIYSWCKNNPNCYFKQLQRLKKENKKPQIIKDEYKKCLEEIKTNAEAKIKKFCSNCGLTEHCEEIRCIPKDIEKDILDKINKVLNNV